MKLHYGKTYWDKFAKGIEINFDKLRKNIKTQILIVGGGMSGSLAAYFLAKKNYKVIVAEKNQIGQGSSMANTGLLQYWSDIMLWELAEQIGEEDAVLFYKMCLQSMYDLNDIAKSLSYKSDYKISNSIYYASNEEDMEKLEKEYKYLKKHNFPVEFIRNDRLIKEYGIDKPIALKTFQDASVNPYEFIYALSKENTQMGVEYFENTEVDLGDINLSHVYANDKYKIEFDKIILATGYSYIYPVVKDKIQINRTYAISSKKLDKLPWKENVMFWETKDPYLYFRVTDDKRIVVGGLDEEINEVLEDDNKLGEKSKELANKFNALVSGDKISVEYQWNALFGESKDNLPFLGVDPDNENKYYILGYEGNGTCYSLAGAQIILDLIEGNENPYSEIVKIDR